MKKTILLICILFSCQIFCQKDLIKGYIIKNDKKRIECYFLKDNIYSNPKEIRYTTEENGVFSIANALDIKEFGIPNELRYISEIVDIEQSSQSFQKLDSNGDLKNVTKQVFLKYLIEGDCNLLEYTHNNNFYILKDGVIEQLIFKKYLQGIFIKENNSFKSQLSEKLTCNISSTDIFKSTYDDKSLKNLFLKHNECYSKKEVIIYKNKRSKNNFHFALKFGVQSSRLDINTLKVGGAFYPYLDTYDYSFSNKIGLKFGVEAEIELPISDYKYSVFIEPSYNSINNKLTENNITIKEFKLNRIEIPVGIRYSFFKNKQHRIYLNCGPVLNIPLNSYYISKNKEFSKGEGNLSFLLGLGYRFNNKLSLELRYFTNEEIFNRSQLISSSLSSYNLTFGYMLF